MPDAKRSRFSRSLLCAFVSKELIGIREQQLGEKHPATAASLYNLAKLYRAQGRYGEAEPLYQHALAISE
jgi:tetratricopeptide (TPR) repeat protein